MPFLTEGQAEDIAFAERRFNSETGGGGVLFTNSTGTGKTFTGLGIAKRSHNRGKGNILILTPKQTVADAWVKAGRDFFDLTVGKLDSTTDAGTGIVVTTYANLGENRELATREWDLVIPDEAHYLSSDKTGKQTKALEKLRILTYKRFTDRGRARMLRPVPYR